MNDTESDLDRLASQWLEAKRSEEKARDARVKIEQWIIEITGCKEEGSQTHKAGDQKITVTGKLNRKLYAGKWEEIKKAIPEQLHPVKYNPTLDLKGLRWLEENEPTLYRYVTQAIETKPAKPGVEVK